MTADKLLAGLNPRQLEAVTHGEGPLLVLAGAGSGKTRVLTHRIAWLVRERGVDPRQIMALTFTNKAAAEMKERLHNLLGDEAEKVWLGTFHAIALRILRHHAEHLPVGKNFAVYDTDDQKRLGRTVLSDLRLDPKKFSVTALLSTVSREKEDGRGPENALPGGYGPFAEAARNFYAHYQKKLREARALDFGDLLVEVLRLFTNHPEIGDQYARRFKHLLIDEYQDTNRLQYLIATRISQGWGNLAAVGDDDQSIYGWRGADVGNILKFEEKFKNAKVVRLEQNYRSTQLILDAAGSIIKKNEGRLGKTLWTEKEGGEPVRIIAAATEEEEARLIATRIRELAARGERYASIAVLYRTHALSRPIEEALLYREIPYAVFGGLRFYERREIKDLLSYLRLCVNPADPVSLFRVINTPPRGIGERSLDKINEEAARLGVDLWEAAKTVVRDNHLGARGTRALAGFLTMVEEWIEISDKVPAVELLERIIKETGYREALEADKDGRGVDRLENVVELLSAVETFDREEGLGVAGFLDRAALVSEQDRTARGFDAVSLMTIHSAKGLEFPTVFVAGLEEGVFPHALSASTPDELEEERRLCYVAMTRAGERLYLTRAASRRVYGAQSEARLPSRFLSELPPHLRPTDLPKGPPPPAYSTPPTWSVRRSPPKPPEVTKARLPPPSTPGGRYFLPDPEEARYAPGMHVRHGRYGEGRVVEISGSGPRGQVTVAFPDGATRRFVIGPAGLEIRLDA